MGIKKTLVHLLTLLSSSCSSAGLSVSPSCGVLRCEVRMKEVAAHRAGVEGDDAGGAWSWLGRNGGLLLLSLGLSGWERMVLAGARPAACLWDLCGGIGSSGAKGLVQGLALAQPEVRPLTSRSVWEPGQ